MVKFQHQRRVDRVELTDLYKIFRRIDTDGDGYIDAKEIAACLKRLGYKPKGSSEVDEMVWLADDDGDNKLSWEEVQMAYRRSVDNSSGCEPMGLFTAFEFMLNDKDGGGTIEMDECLQIMLRRYGDRTAIEKMAEYFTLDKNGDEVIELPEFYGLVCRNESQDYNSLRNSYLELPRSWTRGQEDDEGRCKRCPRSFWAYESQGSRMAKDKKNRPGSPHSRASDVDASDMSQGPGGSRAPNSAPAPAAARLHLLPASTSADPTSQSARRRQSLDSTRRRPSVADPLRIAARRPSVDPSCASHGTLGQRKLSVDPSNRGSVIPTAQTEVLPRPPTKSSRRSTGRGGAVMNLTLGGIGSGIREEDPRLTTSRSAPGEMEHCTSGLASSVMKGYLEKKRTQQREDLTRPRRRRDKRSTTSHRPSPSLTNRRVLSQTMQPGTTPLSLMSTVGPGINDLPVSPQSPPLGWKAYVQSPPSALLQSTPGPDLSRTFTFGKNSRSSKNDSQLMRSMFNPKRPTSASTTDSVLSPGSFGPTDISPRYVHQLSTSRLHERRSPPLFLATPPSRQKGVDGRTLVKRNSPSRRVTSIRGDSPPPIFEPRIPSHSNKNEHVPRLTRRSLLGIVRPSAEEGEITMRGSGGGNANLARIREALQQKHQMITL
eukprot:Rmarinus@m.14096